MGVMRPRAEGATMKQLAARSISATAMMMVVVVNLAPRLPQFLGSASSGAPEGLGSQYDANLVRD